jgi:hypothetical protein
MLSNIEIARAATPKPIVEVARGLGIADEAVYNYGPGKAKIDLRWLDRLERPDGRLVLVTAITPTPAGEGKTTTTVGLGDALNRIGKKAVICLREPSLGPCFRMKGCAGGGYSQVIPMEDINLHFTGDFAAIAAANNLLAAMVDNHIYWGNALDIDVRRITWRRAMDMNDRALGDGLSLGGVARLPARDGFGIVVAPEVMAIFCSPPASTISPSGSVDRRRRDPRPMPVTARDSSPWRDVGAAQGRAVAQPRPDHRGQSGHHPWRAVRQHRPRLQLRGGDPRRPEARRLRRHRGRLRVRSRRREVPRHQVPGRRDLAPRRRARRDAPGAEVPRRRPPRTSAPRTWPQSCRRGNLARHS